MQAVQTPDHSRFSRGEAGTALATGAHPSLDGVVINDSGQILLAINDTPFAAGLNNAAQAGTIRNDDR